MKKYGIPTAKYETFDDPAKVMEYIKAEGKYPVVIKVYDESPAKEAGIQVGNYITAVDGTDVKSMSSVDAVSYTHLTSATPCGVSASAP